MRIRHSDEYIRRRLLARSAVDGSTPLINGCHCRKFLRSLRGGYGRLWDGERLVDTHRLSFEVNIGPIPDGKDVLHRCDEPACIEQEHLWAGTHAENMADKMLKGRGGHEKLRGRKRPGTGLQGQKHPRAILTEDQVRAIKPRLMARHEPVTVIAAEYGVSPSLLYGIRHGTNWSWL